MEEIIKVENLCFEYEPGLQTINNISFQIHKGEYVAILGHNGSGKSTIAKLLIGLLEKKSGEIYIDDYQLNLENLYKIREKVGIVFQNPDNQFIGATVRDDIAFGLENICVPREQMDELIKLNIEYEVVPGVSSFVAAAASIKREFTLPSVSQTVILTRVEGRTKVPEKEDLEKLASIGASMALFLSISMIDKVVAKLRKGYGRDVSIAVIERATWQDERVIFGTLDDISEKVKEAGIKKCAQILVGDFIDCDYEKSLLYDKSFTHEYRKGI